MIKTILLLSGIGLIGSLLFYLARKISLYKECYDGLSIKHKRFTIAILVPTMQTPANLFFKGFISHLKKFASFEFETLECVTNDDRESTYKWAEYIVSNNIDLACTLGKSCTDTLYRIMMPRNHKIPIVSGGALEDFCEIPFATLQKNMPFTGTTSAIDWPNRIALLKNIYPHVKRILILFRSIDEISHRNLKEKNNITSALRKYHVAWEMHHITNIEKSCELDAATLKNIDLVIISHSSELMPYASHIAQTCSTYNVPVFSTDLTSPDIFIGISQRTEEEIGRRCAQQTMQILEDGKDPSTIPIKQCEGKYKIVVSAQNATPLTATAVIGHALTLNPYIQLTLGKKA